MVLGWSLCRRRGKEVRWEGPRPQLSAEEAFVPATGSPGAHVTQRRRQRLGICLPFPSMLVAGGEPLWAVGWAQSVAAELSVSQSRAPQSET